MAPHRHRTSLVAGLLLVPIVAGGFLLQEPPARANARLFDQVVSIVSRQYVDSIKGSELLARAARGLVKELEDPYTELFSPRESEEFSLGTNGRYGGTGMQLEEEEDADRPASHCVRRSAGQACRLTRAPDR